MRTIFWFSPIAVMFTGSFLTVLFGATIGWIVWSIGCLWMVINFCFRSNILNRKK